MGRFIIKHIDNRKPQVKMYPSDTQKPVVKENKKKVNEQVMTTSEKIAMAQNVLSGADQAASVKRVKRDRRRIKRTERSKTILTEDNKELWND